MSALDPAVEAGLLAKFDVGKDGRLSAEEKAAIREHKSRVLAKFDANQNGKLDRAKSGT